MNEPMHEGENNLVPGDTVCSTGRSVFLCRFRVSEREKRVAAHYPDLGCTDFHGSLLVVLGGK